tara:strand:- start:180 stop:329 length:150 start_codon:yes stop_codon:yes gene_type:complete
MKVKIPIYLTKLINKHPSILSGRKNIKKNYERIIKTKKLIKKFNSKKIS